MCDDRGCDCGFGCVSDPRLALPPETHAVVALVRSSYRRAESSRNTRSHWTYETMGRKRRVEMGRAVV